MALGTGGWFPRGPGHDVEAGHEDDVARGLEADDALLLALVLDGSARSFLRYFSRRGGEGVVELGEFGRVAPRRRDVKFAELLDERSARRGPLAQLRASLRERLAAGARIHLEAVGAPFRALGPLAQLRDLGRFSSCISRSSKGVHHAPQDAAEAVAFAARPARVAALLFYVYGFNEEDAVTIIEPHEDALALEASDLPALAVDGCVGGQAVELDPHGQDFKLSLLPEVVITQVNQRSAATVKVAT